MNPVLVSGLRMPEGPAFDKAGNLYVTEMGNGQISKITPDGARTVLATPGGSPNGARIGPDGALWITNANRPNPGRSSGSTSRPGTSSTCSQTSKESHSARATI